MIGAKACLKNQEDGYKSELVSVEPYPRQFLKDGFPGLGRHITSKVQDLELSFFDQLQANDILFIDCSHVSRIGSDVQFLYLEVLPRLREGVVVHAHDIFLPYEYPREWVVQNRVFWNEQYLLQAFLSLNPEYEVLFSNYYMRRTYPEKMRVVFTPPPGHRARNLASSFWMRRVPSSGKEKQVS